MQQNSIRRYYVHIKDSSQQLKYVHMVHVVWVWVWVIDAYVQHTDNM